jgi:hypothetical protein
VLGHSSSSFIGQPERNICKLLQVVSFDSCLLPSSICKFSVFHINIFSCQAGTSRQGRKRRAPEDEQEHEEEEEDSLFAENNNEQYHDDAEHLQQRRVQVPPPRKEMRKKK